jgi:hypothetical protein
MLSRALKGDVIVVKIGHGSEKGKPEILCRSIEDARQILSARIGKSERTFTILESNRAFDVAAPDLSVFIEGSAGREKRSARRARRKADIIIGPRTNLPDVESILRNKGLFADCELFRVANVLRDFHRGLTVTSGKEKRPSE